jgi:hypothetical protein
MERPTLPPTPTQRQFERLLASVPQATTPVREPVIYVENLWEYIDGAAESYHNYGFVALLHREFKTSRSELTVDIYDMGAALNAFGIYAAERPPDQAVIPIGAEGYLDEYALHFYRDHYYVKLSAYAESDDAQARRDEARRTLETMAEAISRQIGGSRSPPGVFALLPDKERVPGSERFLGRYPLGYDFLAPAIQADFRVADRRSTLVLSETGNPAEASQRVARLRQHFERLGSVAAAPEVAPGVWRGHTSFEGTMLFFAQGRHVVILVSPPAAPAILLAATQARLSSAEPGKTH